MTLRRLIPTRLWDALLLVWDSGPRWTVASAGLVLVQTVLSLAALGLVKLVIDTVAASLTGPRPADGFQPVALFVGLGAGVAILIALFRSLAGLVSEVQSSLVSDHIHRLLQAKAVQVDLAYYENSRYYDSLHLAQQQAPQRATTILANLLQLGSSGIAITAIAGLLVALNWWVALLLIVGAFPGALVRVRFASALYQWQRQRAATERRAEYFNSVLTSGYFAPEVRLFDLGSLFRDRFGAVREQLRHERQEIATRRLSAELATQVGATAAMYGAYGFVAYQVLAGAITLGDLVMYYAAFQRAQGHLQEFLGGLARFYEDNLFLTSLSDFMALEQNVADPVAPCPVPRPLRTGIAFEHVDFRYPGASRLALDDVSLTIHPGERIAIVGQNGSGKTTLVKLICRLYDPTAGRITVDGTPLPGFAQAAWRREVGVCLQYPVPYQATARDNIWFGNLAPLADDASIVAAARCTGADAVIERLPQGYDTPLGKWVHDGAELSGGEWQRIALARAYLRDAQLVILDEPTSAIDALAERALLETLWRVAEDRMTIVISHRLSTVRMADRIYVLAEGRVVEAGTHHELMRLGGAYADLFSAQAQHYQMPEPLTSYA